MTDDRVLTPHPEPEDLQTERSLRPRSLHEFIGQTQTKEHLSIILDAARARGEAADHLLFAGSPGLGKTTLAHIISSELGVGLKVTSGPALERLGDLAAILTNLEERDVLFIDEIHRLSRPVEEMMYPAMEDGKIDLVIGKGPSARSIRLDLPPFTLVGATTRTGLLTSPLRDRFGFLGKLDFYEPEELVDIVLRSARLMELTIEPAAAQEIAGRSRGTPRISNRLLRRVRDYSQIKADGTVTLPITKAALSLFGVDDEGLDKVDKSILVALVERFRGQPVGLNTLAVAIGEEPETLEDVYEPFLLRRGFIQRTPRGRKATVIAYEHLGMLEPAADRLL